MRVYKNRMKSKDAFSPPLDDGITGAVLVLSNKGVETYESCDGSRGHSYSEPTVRFHGGRSEGFRALDVALKHGLKVRDLRRIWTIIDGEPTGPSWEMTFWREPRG